MNLMRTTKQTCVTLALYPRVIVSKSQEDTSKYVDTVTIFQIPLTKRSMTPR